MKKIRYIPYGYTMRNGRTVIAQDEAMVIREIFSAYINGASLQSIAELLTERKIPYSERTDVWDKARIARIIGNAKYLGDGEYDPIIEEEQYEEAAAVRTARQRNTFEKNLEGIDLLRDLVRCAECGASMRRRVSSKHRIRESWECANPGCGQRIRISDTHLLEKVTILMNRIITNSYLLIPRPKKRKELSAEAQQISREIDAELERDDPSDALIRPARFVICDGDIVELKNLDRQNFVPADLGENKARILAERYSTVLGMETEYVPNFIETLPELMALIAPNLWETDGFRNRYAAEMVILLGCVDNNRTRQLCHEAFRQSEDLVYIDSGNGSYTGQVVCGVRRNGHTMRKPIGSVHPEMLRITDKFPSELSCAEAAQADPQSIVANVMAATAVLTMVYNILTHGENIALQTDFSTRTIRMQTVLEKQSRRNAA